MTTSDHLTPRSGRHSDDRGLLYMPEVHGTHPGTSVEVHESSAADAPHIWLNFRWDQREYGVHLPAESAWRLKEQIEHLIERHYQGDARPKPCEGTGRPSLYTGDERGVEWRECPACGAVLETEVDMARLTQPTPAHPRNHAA